MKRLGQAVVLAGLLLGGSAQALLDLTDTPEAVGENVLTTYQRAGSAREALVQLFGVDDPDVDLLEGIEKNMIEYSSKLDMCSSNLKNLGTACEMYSTDHHGKYPATLAELTPGYLKTIPQCPAAGTDLYSSSYKSSTLPDTYSFHCSGKHHANMGVAENLPGYNGEVGLHGYPTTKKPSQRSSKVKQVHVADNGVQAVVLIEETSQADLDRPAVTGLVKVKLLKSDYGWMIQSFELLPDTQQETAIHLLNYLLLQSMGVRVSDHHGAELESGEDALLNMTPLQHMVIMSQLEDSPILQAMEGLKPPDYQISERVDTLRHVAKLAEKYRDQHKAWPATLDQLVGADRIDKFPDLKTLAFRPSADGKTLDLQWPNQGYPFFEIPAGYPTVQVFQDRPAKVIYRP